MTRQSGVESGPYFEDAHRFPSGVNDGRAATQYLSVQRVREILSAPGSPFACVDVDEFERLVRVEAELGLEVDRLRDQVAELQGELAAVLERGVGVDVGALARELVAGLEVEGARVARKPGRPRAVS